MASKNAVSLIGNLGKDPEFNESGNTQSARLSVATVEKWKDKVSGEWKEITEWHKVVAFGSQAIYASKYLHKGSMVAIDGHLKTSKYSDSNGIEKYSTQIIARELQGLDKKPDTQQSSQQDTNKYSNKPKQQHDQYNDIPF